jgi:hypothetical protein
MFELKIGNRFQKPVSFALLLRTLAGLVKASDAPEGAAVLKTVNRSE